MKNYGQLWSDASRRLLYGESRREAAVCDSGPKPTEAGRVQDARGCAITTIRGNRAAKRGNTWGVALTCQQGSRCQSSHSGIHLSSVGAVALRVAAGPVHSGCRVTQLLADPIMALAALVVLLLVGALVWAGSRRPYVREVERLREDLHNLLASERRSRAHRRQRPPERIRRHLGLDEPPARSRR